MYLYVSPHPLHPPLTVPESPSWTKQPSAKLPYSASSPSSLAPLSPHSPLFQNWRPPQCHPVQLAWHHLLLQLSHIPIPPKSRTPAFPRRQMDEVLLILSIPSPLPPLTPHKHQHLSLGRHPLLPRRLHLLWRPFRRPLSPRNLRGRHHPRFHDRHLHVLHPRRTDPSCWLLVSVPPFPPPSHIAHLPFQSS